MRAEKEIEGAVEPCQVFVAMDEQRRWAYWPKTGSSAREALAQVCTAQDPTGTALAAIIERE